MPMTLRLRTNASILAASAAIALAGCSAEPDEGSAGGDAMDMADVKAQTDKIAKPEPGQYSMKVTVEKISMAGAPEGTADTMKQIMESGFANSYCLTPEDAEKGFDEVFDQLSQGGDCDFSDYAVDDGNIEGSATCDMQGGTMTYSMKGKAWETGSDMTADMSMQAAGQSMDLTVHMVSERTGDCAA